MKKFIPMKGERLNPLDEKDMARVQFPILASPKIDGIRALVRDRKLVTFKLKNVPNFHACSLFAKKEFEGLEGELVLNGANSFRKTSSAVMTRTGTPDLIFQLFDDFKLTKVPFEERLDSIAGRLAVVGNHKVTLLKHELIKDLDELMELEDHNLQLGYEGTVIRSPNGLYKYGRSTIREAYMLKLTRRITEEAKVVGFIERQKNNNPQERDEHGKAKRSNHKANKSGRGDLGAIVVRNPKYEKEFEVGTGFTDAERKEIWAHPRRYINRIVRYEFSPVGDYEVPRMPTFQGFRDPRDFDGRL